MTAGTWLFNQIHTHVRLQAVEEASHASSRKRVALLPHFVPGFNG